MGVEEDGVADASGTGFWGAAGGPESDLRDWTRRALDGRALSDTVRIPPGYSLRRATGRGFLLGDLDSVVLWDPARRAEVARVDHVTLVGSSADRVVWHAAGCEAGCRLTWSALPDGADWRCGSCAEVDVPLAYRGGALSPGGRLVAVRGHEHGLAVCDDRRCEAVGGAEGVAVGELLWIDDATLVAGAGEGALMAWRSGWGSWRPVPGDHTGAVLARSAAVLGP